MAPGLGALASSGSYVWSMEAVARPTLLMGEWRWLTRLWKSICYPWSLNIFAGSFSGLFIVYRSVNSFESSLSTLKALQSNGAEYCWLTSLSLVSKPSIFIREIYGSRIVGIFCFESKSWLLLAFIWKSFESTWSSFSWNASSFNFYVTPLRSFSIILKSLKFGFDVIFGLPIFNLGFLESPVSLR